MHFSIRPHHEERKRNDVKSVNITKQQNDNRACIHAATMLEKDEGVLGTGRGEHKRAERRG